MIFFFYAAVLLFSGNPQFTFRGLTVGWIQGGIELAFITVGIWTPATVESFKVMRRAADFDNDDDDDDNQQQTVMTLLGRSRGLIWLPIPIGVVMTKVAEALNDPPPPPPPPPLLLLHSISPEYSVLNAVSVSLCLSVCLWPYIISVGTFYAE